MESESRFSWKKRAKAFRYAWQGMRSLVRYEHNARIHLVAAVLALAAGIVFGITPMEWCLIILCIALVISAEALNSAVEALADKLCKEQDPLIGRAKDLGATAVTLLAFAAAAVGLIIFIPYIVSLFKTWLC